MKSVVGRALERSRYEAWRSLLPREQVRGHVAGELRELGAREGWKQGHRAVPPHGQAEKIPAATS
jgi:hypothetical protein